MDIPPDTAFGDIFQRYHKNRIRTLEHMKKNTKSGIWYGR